jgi:hypothetical protein
MSQPHIVAPHGMGRPSSRHNASRITANDSVQTVPGNTLSQGPSATVLASGIQDDGMQDDGIARFSLNTISDFLNPDAGNRVPSATRAFEPAQSLPFCRRNIRSERALPPQAAKKYCAVRRHHYQPYIAGRILSVVTVVNFYRANLLWSELPCSRLIFCLMRAHDARLGRCQRMSLNRSGAIKRYLSSARVADTRRRGSPKSARKEVAGLPQHPNVICRDE